jgi:2-haloacid dehalogenase
LVAHHVTGDLDTAMERAGAMDPFPEAGAALGLLHDAGIRTGVLTNSPTAGAERSLQRAGLDEDFEVVIGTDAVGSFKPHPLVYRHAVERLQAKPAEICLVAAHGWDVMGGMRAGLRGAWVARTERWLPPTIPEPDVRGEDLEDAARSIVSELAGAA